MFMFDRQEDIIHILAGNGGTIIASGATELIAIQNALESVFQLAMKPEHAKQYAQDVAAHIAAP